MSYNELLSRIEKLPIIDSHEHFSPEAGLVGGGYDFFDLLVPYIVDTLMNAGMSFIDWQKVCDKNLPFSRRWALFLPYLEEIRHTTTFRALAISLKDLYDKEIRSQADAEEVTRRLQSDMVPGLYDKTLKKRGILKALTFVGCFGTVGARDAFLEPIPTVSDFMPRDAQGIAAIEASTGVRVRNIESLGKAIDAQFKYYQDNKIRALKFGSGYHRLLNFAQPDEHEAARVLNKIVSGKIRGDDLMLGRISQTMSIDEALPLDDWVTERFVSLAEDTGMPVIFHVAMHAWNANNPEYAHAHYLTDLLFRHPKLQLEILHAGAPFCHEAILLARYFPNVYLNFAWSHVIDRQVTRDAIRSCVEVLPRSKVIAFGGDCCYPQQIPGHLSVALENLSRGLWPLVDEGVLTLDEAVSVARQWLYDNPKRYYSLTDC